MMERVNIRITKEEKKHLQAVAKSRGQTLSTFLRDAAQQEATRIIRGFAALATPGRP